MSHAEGPSFATRERDANGLKTTGREGTRSGRMEARWLFGLAKSDGTWLEERERRWWPLEGISTPA
jgi:hypothetical protein